MRIRFSAICDRGPVRAQNQDRYLVSDFETTLNGAHNQIMRLAESRRGILLAVADGMGGHAGGAEAAELALTTLIEAYKGFLDKKDPLGGLSAAMEAANDAVLKRSAKDRALRGMGTTLTAVCLHGRFLHLGHVGDTRAYLLRRGALTPLTTDHNMLTTILGMDDDDARRRVGGNVLAQCVGGRTADIAVESVRVPLCRGDRVLLCSDGLHGSVNRDQIQRLLAKADLARACRGLLEEAIAGGTTDNVTALLAQVQEKSLPAAKWDTLVQVERVAEVIYDRRAKRIRNFFP